MMEAGGGEWGAGGRDERVPQWGAQETRELIAARGEQEREAVAAHRSAKTLWEAVASRLRERGYRRTADQCKCKWKNLVNRYKGKETSDPENGRHCPFFEELHAVFTERARNMQQLLQSESGSSLKKKLKRSSGDLSLEESDDEEDEAEESGDEKPMKSRKKKAADKRQQSQRMAEKLTGMSSIRELLQDFLVQQQHMDIRWHEMMERRSQERLFFEQEWRQSMQKLEQERLMLEHTWMEREQQRRMREEARAEKRDALLTTLLNKLLQEDL
ncbi:hypothetical protein ABZP36_002796 [Zizania latifolia]